MVLIVAKCIVNLLNPELEEICLFVLIVAKCIVNPTKNKGNNTNKIMY